MKDHVSKQPKDYTNQIDELNGGLGVILEAFTQTYVLAKMHPNNEDIQDRYQAVISSIEQMQSTLFALSNDVQASVQTVNQQLLELNELIQQEKSKNKELKTKLGLTEHKQHSTTEMIHDYKEMYDIAYLRNWALVASIGVCIFAISRSVNSLV